MTSAAAIMAALDCQRRRDLFRLGIETDEPTAPPSWPVPRPSEADPADTPA